MLHLLHAWHALVNPDQIRYFTCLAHAVRLGGHDAWSLLSPREKMTIALALNHADWLGQMGLTMAEAIHRIGPDHSKVLLEIERESREEVFNRPRQSFWTWWRAPRRRASASSSPLS